MGVGPAAGPGGPALFAPSGVGTGGAVAGPTGRPRPYPGGGSPNAGRDRFRAGQRGARSTDRPTRRARRRAARPAPGLHARPRPAPADRPVPRRSGFPWERRRTADAPAVGRGIDGGVRPACARPAAPSPATGEPPTAPGGAGPASGGPPAPGRRRRFQKFHRRFLGHPGRPGRASVGQPRRPGGQAVRFAGPRSEPGNLLDPTPSRRRQDPAVRSNGRGFRRDGRGTANRTTTRSCGRRPRRRCRARRASRRRCVPPG